MLALAFLFLAHGSAQSSNTGRAEYVARCAACHGGDGAGGERAPGIIGRLPLRTDAQLAELIRSGLPGAGMPGIAVSDAGMTPLIQFLRSLRSPRVAAPESISIRTTTGESMSGTVLNRGYDELQLLDSSRRIRILRKEGDRYRPVTSQSDWPAYHGTLDGNRYSKLKQIDRGNVSTLAPKWMFAIPSTARLQVTPVVVDGVMYVTGPNECYALDPGTGRQLWQYRRPRTRGLAGDAGSGINRGVAILGERLFMVTDNAHLIALQRFTGALLWESVMADSRQNYGATSAPLAVAGLVISGISGGDEGVRGFLAAYNPEDGKEIWRFWTVPKPGEPKSETWIGPAIDHGCAATWLTGTYDEQSSALYWPTGNPCPDYNGDVRRGDNLYSDSMLALDPRTGKLKWHYQYTPHDLWDWDSQQPPVLADSLWRGQPRKLLLHANRNGFFYVLDRLSGELLLAKPMVRKLTWASGIGADGRPVRNPGQEPTAGGTKVCPAVEGATNWFSTAFDPVSRLYIVQTLEKCNIFFKTPGQWEAGKSYYDGSTRTVPGEPGQKILRAFDIDTGSAKWEFAQNGPANTWGGVLATAGGVVFFGEDSGSFMAVDSATGKPLWQFPVHITVKASPMTYMFDGRQYVAVAYGQNIVSFGLPQPSR